MNIDEKIREAIETAVIEMRQDRTLATKLVRWFDAIASGNEDITATDLADRHLDLLYAATRTGTAPYDAANDDDDTQQDHDEKVM